jgi:excisionase family DNA binding protein
MEDNRPDNLTPIAGTEISISVDEAARRTGVCRASLYNLMADGKLAYVKLGTRRVLLVSDVLAMMEANRHVSARKAA